MNEAPSAAQNDPAAADGASSVLKPEKPGDADQPGAPRVPGPVPRWMRVLPFFASAAFFLSALLALVSPVPLLILRLQYGRKLAGLALLTNALLVFAGGGALSLALYLTFVVALVIPLSELMARGARLERAAGFALLAMGLTAVVSVAALGAIFHVNPMHEFREQISLAVSQLDHSLTENLGSVSDPEELQRRVMVEFPSVIAWMMLGMVWVNSLILLRLNPGAIRERMQLEAGYTRRWKTPEWLVWPTLASGFLLLVDLGHVSEVGINLFKFLMAVYAIQGLSILAFFFDVWNVRGAFRFVGFLVCSLLMMPLLLSLGFFDLWFDFRSKFRQS